jgi:hypothetical protein
MTRSANTPDSASKMPKFRATLFMEALPERAKGTLPI